MEISGNQDDKVSKRVKTAMLRDIMRMGGSLPDVTNDEEFLREERERKRQATERLLALAKKKREQDELIKEAAKEVIVEEAQKEEVKEVAKEEIKKDLKENPYKMENLFSDPKSDAQDITHLFKKDYEESLKEEEDFDTEHVAPIGGEVKRPRAHYRLGDEVLAQDKEKKLKYRKADKSLEPKMVEDTGIRLASAGDDLPLLPEDQPDLPTMDQISDLPKIPETTATPEAQIVEDVFASAMRGAENTQSLIGDVLGSVSDIGTGFAHGLSAGFIDELAAAGLAAGDVAFTDADIEDFVERYRERHKDTEGFIEKSRERSPVLFTGSEIGGGLLAGLYSGGAAPLAKGAGLGAKALQSAKIGMAGGALYGAGESEGKLIGGSELDRKQFYDDTVFGGLSGGLFGAGGELVMGVANKLFGGMASRAKDKMVDYLKDTDIIRAEKHIYNWGKQGMKGSTSSIGTDIEKFPNKKTIQTAVNNEGYSLADDFLRGDKVVSDRVGLAVKRGQQIGDYGLPEMETIRGRKGTRSKISERKAELNLGDEIENAIKNLERNGGRLVSADVGSSAKDLHSVRDYLRFIQDPNRQFGDDVGEGTHKLWDYTWGDEAADTLHMTAEQAKDFLDELTDLYQATEGTRLVQQEVLNLRRAVDKKLRDNVVGYAEAMDDMANFRTHMQDNILNAGTRPDYRKHRYSDKKFREAEFITKLDSQLLSKLTMGQQRTGVPIREQMVEYLYSLDPDKESTKAIFSALGINNPLEWAAKVTRVADQKHALALLQSHVAMNPLRTTVGGTVTEELAGSGAKAIMSNMVSRLGQEVGSGGQTIKDISPMFHKIGKSIFRQPDDVLLSLADNISANPVLKPWGDKLRQSVERNDRNGINAALFVLMQRPDMRKLIGSEE